MRVWMEDGVVVRKFRKLVYSWVRLVMRPPICMRSDTAQLGLSVECIYQRIGAKDAANCMHALSPQQWRDLHMLMHCSKDNRSY
jgi:hypothetical protein